MNEALNKKIITWTCYLCYFFTGSLVTVTGIVLGPIANYYHYRPWTVSYIFTAQNGAMFLAIIFGGILMTRFSFKKLLLTGILIEFAGLAMLHIFLSFPFSFLLFMAIIGFAGGMFMAVGSFLIIYIYKDPKTRSIQVVMAVLFFSLSGVILPIFAERFLKYGGCSWLFLYYILTLFAILLLFLVILAKFPNILSSGTQEKKEEVRSEKWGLAVYLLAFSCFFFMVGELVYAEWLPIYLQKYLLFPEAKSANFISLFWIFMAVGLFAGRFVMKYFQLPRFIMFCFIGATIFAITSCIVPSVNIVMFSVILFGLFNSIIYPSILSYGSLQLSYPPPSLISFIVGVATLGTMSYTAISGFAGNFIGIHAALNVSWIFYLFSMTLFFFGWFFSKAEKIHGSIKQQI